MSFYIYIHVWWRGRECFRHGGNQANHQYFSLSCTLTADIHKHGWHFFATLMIVREHSSCVFVSVEACKIYCHFMSMVVSLWTYSSDNCTLLSPSICLLVVSVVCGLCSQYELAFLHAYMCMKAYVCISYPSGQILCNLVFTDLMRVESWWPCGVTLVPGASRAAGLTQIVATFALLAANFPGLLHVLFPRHQHGEDTPSMCGMPVILPLLEDKKKEVY